MKDDQNARRQFLKRSAYLAGGGLLASSEAFGILKSRSHMTQIVGHGNFRYRVDKEWGVQDPAKIPVNDCHEMVLDSQGRIHMTTTGENNSNILVYDRLGKVLDSWGSFPGAHGLSIFGEGKDQYLFITDPNTHLVHKTTLDGRVLMTLKRPMEVDGYASDEEFLPTETAILPNGEFYVADGYGKNYIIHYDANGKYLNHFGGTGDDGALFSCAHGITIDYRKPDNPTLLITSRSTQEFKRFTLGGEHLETIRLPGCWICRPVIDGDNLYFAVIVTKTWDHYDGILAVLDGDNKVVSFPGGDEPMYIDGVLKAPEYDGSTFRNPHDVLVDGDGNLYIPQWASGKTYPIKLHRV